MFVTCHLFTIFIFLVWSTELSTVYILHIIQILVIKCILRRGKFVLYMHTVLILISSGKKGLKVLNLDFKKCVAALPL